MSSVQCRCGALRAPYPNPNPPSPTRTCSRAATRSSRSWCGARARAPAARSAAGPATQGSAGPACAPGRAPCPTRPRRGGGKVRSGRRRRVAAGAAAALPRALGAAAAAGRRPGGWPPLRQAAGALLTAGPGAQDMNAKYAGQEVVASVAEVSPLHRKLMLSMTQGAHSLQMRTLHVRPQTLTLQPPAPRCGAGLRDSSSVRRPCMPMRYRRLRLARAECGAGRAALGHPGRNSKCALPAAPPGCLRDADERRGS